jgi:hypothetical protein
LERPRSAPPLAVYGGDTTWLELDPRQVAAFA